MNEITIKKVEPILMASVRKKVPISQFNEDLGTMWREVNGYIDAKGGKRTIPCMILYHIGWWDIDETSMLEIEVAEPITKKFEGNEKVIVYELPAVDKMVCIIHKGQYSTLQKTNEVMFEWIRQNGYTKKGPVREIYHKGDWATQDSWEYITELQVPIE